MRCTLLDDLLLGGPATEIIVVKTGLDLVGIYRVGMGIRIPMGNVEPGLVPAPDLVTGVRGMFPVYMRFLSLRGRTPSSMAGRSCADTSCEEKARQVSAILHMLHFLSWEELQGFRDHVLAAAEKGVNARGLTCVVRIGKTPYLG